MTSEDDFQAMLDADPSDWSTRLIFADWLDDRGDPRAEACRALGVLRLAPFRTDRARWVWWNAGLYAREQRGCSHLPRDWYGMIGKAKSHPRFCRWSKRLIAEKNAILAFAKLPAERRAELLQGTVTA